MSELELEWTTAGKLAIGLALLLFLGRQALKTRSPYPLPPGPVGLPWVGKATGIDPNAPWITFSEWTKKYGDLICIRLLGKHIIIINSEKIAKELLDGRSGNYSDRPALAAAEGCGLSFNTALLRHGDRWRQHRRFFHQTFRPDALSRFLPYQHRKSCHLLLQLLNAPEQLGDHVFEYTASVMLKSVYNYEPASRKDELVDVAGKVLGIVVPYLRADKALVAGALLCLPSWLPGMSFKKGMAVARACSEQYLERPFRHSLRETRNGDVAPSMVYDAVGKMEEKGISPEQPWLQELKEAAGTAFLVPSGSTKAVLMTFFLMMVMHPEIQEKAQAQIDDVVGNDRLPTMDDRPLLPFVDAILRETLRHSPVLPLSIPHAALEEDVYNGYYIPKGAIVLPNVWAMVHDESRFPNAWAFVPERFLNYDGSLKPSDMEHIAFGFGRRVCAGKHFADTTVWAVIAKVLAVFKILKSLDKNGVEIPVEPKFSSGLVIEPLPFKYRIVPRLPGMNAERLEQLIASSLS